MMNKLMSLVLLYLAWVVALFTFFNMFVAGAFGVEIFRLMTVKVINGIPGTLVWYRIMLGFIGVIGLWYLVYERFVKAKGR